MGIGLRFMCGGILLSVVSVAHATCAENVIALIPVPQQVSLSFGTGDGVRVSSVRALYGNFGNHAMGSWEIKTRFEWGASYWSKTGERSRNNHIVDLSLTPVALFAYKNTTPLEPYVKLGIGIHAINHVNIGPARTMSTAFQFGEVIEVGARFGEKKEYALGLMIAHVSNGGIKHPNPGLTYAGVSLAYNF